MEERHPVPRPGGDLVELVLHAGGEGVVDLAAEVALQQLDHGERRPGRDHRLALLPHVAAVLDRLHDRRPRRGPPDAQLLQPLDQGRLGVAGRRLGRVADRLDRRVGQHLVDGKIGQQALAVVEVGLGVVRALDVDPQVAGEGDRAARRRPFGGRRRRGRIERRGQRGHDPHRHGLAHRVGHLRRQRPLPDQVVEPQVGAPQVALELLRRAPPVARRADGLVRFLGVLHRAAVLAGSLGQVVVAVQLAHLGAGRGDGLVRERDRVGPHVGDVAPLVEALGRPHHLARGHGQLAPALLLQRRGDEGRLGRAAVRPFVDGRRRCRWPRPAPRPAPGPRSRRPRPRRRVPRGPGCRSPCRWRRGCRRARRGWPRTPAPTGTRPPGPSSRRPRTPCAHARARPRAGSPGSAPARRTGRSRPCATPPRTPGSRRGGRRCAGPPGRRPGRRGCRATGRWPARSPGG